MKIVEVHEINAIDIINISNNLELDKNESKIQRIKKKIDNILNQITVGKIERRIKEDEENPCDYELVMGGECNMNGNEEDDLGDWLIDREDCIEFPSNKNTSEIIFELKSWIEGEGFDTDTIKEDLSKLIEYVERVQK